MGLVFDGDGDGNDGESFFGFFHLQTIPSKSPDSR